MKSENCPELDECYKIKMVLDKDLLDFQYAEAIRAVCANCSEIHQGNKNPSPDISSMTFVAPEEARMTINNRNNLGKMLKYRRLMMPLTLHELAAESCVSDSHLSRIEKGERFPSANILRKIVKPLGFDEGELFTLAGYLSPQPSSVIETSSNGQLDPYVAALLSQEPFQVQHAVIGILSILRSLAKSAKKE